MTNEEAKFTLHAYRPGGRDAADPTFAPALAQAKQDPRLGEWFAREQAHARAVAARLAEVPAPAGLRDAILAGGRASGGGERSRRRPSAWIALGGLAAGIAIAAMLWRGPGRAADSLLTLALEDGAHPERHGGHGGPTGALQAQLSQPGAHLAAGLAIDFAALKQTGCRTLQLGGRDVLEVCFVRDGAEFHCYIEPIDPAATTGRAPDFEQRGRLAVASWSDAAHHFVVVSSAGVEAVRRLL